MEKSPENLVNFSNLPTEIQQEIAAHLDIHTLSFFAISHKRALINVLSLLAKHRAIYSLALTAAGDSTFCYQGDQLFACGSNENDQLGLGPGQNIDFHKFTTVSLPNKIKQMVAGEYHTMMLTEDYQLWTCGNDEFRALGLGYTKNGSFFSDTEELTYTRSSNTYSFKEVKNMPIEMHKLFSLNRAINKMKELAEREAENSVTDLEKSVSELLQPKI